MNGARQTAENQYICKICDVPNKTAAQCPRQAERGQTGYVQAKGKSTHSKLIILCAQAACAFQWPDQVPRPLLLHACFLSAKL